MQNSYFGATTSSYEFITLLGRHPNCRGVRLAYAASGCTEVYSEVTVTLEHSEI